MYGLVLLIDVLRGGEGQNLAAEQRWKGTAIALEACIPEVKREEFNEEIKELKQAVWVEVGMLTFATLIGNTFVLVLDYGVHVFLA